MEDLPHLAQSISIIAADQTGLTDPAELLYPEDTWIGQLRMWVDGLPVTVQWLGIILIAAVPFVESYGGGFIGVVVGMPVWAAVASAVIGNTASVALLVYGTHWIRSQVLRRRRTPELSSRQLKRRERGKRIFDKFGVPGVALFGPLALPSQFTAPMMVSFGASRNRVVIWMVVSILVWGLAFAALGVGLLNLLATQS